jgi:hypothetical protein
MMLAGVPGAIKVRAFGRAIASGGGKADNASGTP